MAYEGQQHFPNKTEKTSKAGQRLVLSPSQSESSSAESKLVKLSDSVSAEIHYRTGW